MSNELRRWMMLVENRDAKQVYRMGRCDVMAIALHRLSGLPLGIWRGYFPDEFGDEGDEAYEDCHAAVVLAFEPPRWIDVDGVQDGKPDCHFDNPVTRIDLIPASEEEVSEAFSMQDLDEATVAQAIEFVKSDAALSDIISRASDR